MPSDGGVESWPLQIETNMLPNLIVIGAMKSATSSLHHYLGLHPEISMSGTKELDFFVEDKNWRRGIEWYESNFTPAKVRGESSPNYTAYPILDGVPERMHRIVPDAKLIYLVRDPIDRMVSHYIHSVHSRREKRTADEALSDFSSIYFVRSLYFMQLEQYLAYYPLAQILVLGSEDLLKDRTPTMRSVFDFLGVDERFESQSFDEIIHSSTSKRKLTGAGVALLHLFRAAKHALPMPHSAHRAAAYFRRSLLSREIPRPTLSQGVREQLTEKIAPDVAKLRDLTGRSFEQWSL